jgi:hypothetical protein
MLYIFKNLSACKASGYLIKLYKPTTKVHIELCCNGEKNGNEETEGMFPRATTFMKIYGIWKKKKQIRQLHKFSF